MTEAVTKKTHPFNSTPLLRAARVIGPLLAFFKIGITMKVTKDVEALVKRWKSAAEEVRDLKRKLSNAECELSNSETDLAKCLLPGDAKANEKFCVWYGDSLIAACHNNGAYFVELRMRGRGWDR